MRNYNNDYEHLFNIIHLNLDDFDVIHFHFDNQHPGVRHGRGVQHIEGDGRVPQLDLHGRQVRDTDARRRVV